MTLRDGRHGGGGQHKRSKACDERNLAFAADRHDMLLREI
jgi:hypothetical protein